MAFVTKQVVVAIIDYKGCDGAKGKGKIEFDFDKSEVTFITGDFDYDEEKATLKIDDLRELIRVYDEQNALSPVQEKPKRKRK